MSFVFAPKGWPFCKRSLLPRSPDTALFSLFGTTCGGNGKSNFAPPDPQGRAPLYPGREPGLSLHDLAEAGGTDTVTLLESEMPSHGGTLRATVNNGTHGSLTAGITLVASVAGALYQSNTASLKNMAPEALCPLAADNRTTP